MSEARVLDSLQHTVGAGWRAGLTSMLASLSGARLGLSSGLAVLRPLGRSTSEG